jgi:hypothetical protein
MDRWGAAPPKTESISHLALDMSAPLHSELGLAKAAFAVQDWRAVLKICKPLFVLNQISASDQNAFFELYE